MSNVKKNAVFNVLNTLLPLVLSLITFSYISRILGPEKFGKFSFFNSIQFYFYTFALFGAQTYGMKELSKITNIIEKNRIFSELLVITLFTSIISSLIYYCFYFILDIDRENLFLYIIFSIQTIGSFLTLNWVYAAEEKFGYIAFVNISVKLFILIFCLINIKSAESLLSYVLIMEFSFIFSGFLYLIPLLKRYKISFKGLNLKRHLKKMLILLIYTFSSTIFSNLDISMLGFFHSEKEVGYYSVAIKIIRLINPVILSIFFVLIPKLANLTHSKEFFKISKILNKTYNVLFILVIPTVFFVALHARKIIFILSGDAYLESVFYLQLLSILILLISLSGFLNSQVLLPFEKESLILVSTLSGVFINIILNIVLIPKYVVLGAIIASIIAEFVVCVIRFYFSKKIIIYKINYFNILKYLLLSGLFILVSISLDYIIDNNIISLGTNFIVDCFLYFGLLYVLNDEIIFNLFRNEK